jgi:hypothetical protein
MSTLKRTMDQAMDKDEGYEGGDEGESCPIATQDITLNLKNRGKAIDAADYGPENPALPNKQYWMKMAEEWQVEPEDAKMSLCGNCAAFNQEESMLECIAEGIGEEGDPWAMIEAGDLGYCEIFDFKCASSRTCSAWVAKEEGEDEGEGEEPESLLTIKIGVKGEK